MQNIYEYHYYGGSEDPDNWSDSILLYYVWMKLAICLTCKCRCWIYKGVPRLGNELLNAWYHLASFRGLPTVHFWLLAVCKNGGGRPGIFYHVNDVSVYLGRQKGRGIPIKRTRLRPYLVDSAPSAAFLNIRKVKNVPLQVRNEERMREMRSFDGGPLPPSVC